jgi:hypothetical protein
MAFTSTAFDEAEFSSYWSRKRDDPKMDRERDTPPTPSWKKSTRSGANGCVEVRIDQQEIFVRDSKDQLGPALRFTPVEWEAFIGGVRAGEFDLLRST